MGAISISSSESLPCCVLAVYSEVNVTLQATRLHVWWSYEGKRKDTNMCEIMRRACRIGQHARSKKTHVSSRKNESMYCTT